MNRRFLSRAAGRTFAGFSAHVGEPIGLENKQRLEDTGAYLVRNPLSLRKLVYLDGQ